MSYLLTEIALEMLGYKFYDCNGVYAPTNFQHNVPDGRNTKTPEISTVAVPGGNKRKLTVNSCGINEGPKGKVGKHEGPNDSKTANTIPTVEAAPKTATATKPNTTSQPVTTKAALPIAAVAAAAATSAAATAAAPAAGALAAAAAALVATPPTAESKNTQTTGQKQPALPIALAKLLAQEYDKTRKEIINNKLHYIIQNPEMAKRVEPRTSNTTNDFVQSYMKEERKLLQKEAQVMLEFRMLTEKKLLSLNKEPFQLYIRNFRLGQPSPSTQQNRQKVNNQE